ncbi:MAG TPA: protoglobin domain-containing protein [Planctomycetota bacterium]|nr:protoglobin domain-containing protein [Planctomycetota bacterium]
MSGIDFHLRYIGIEQTDVVALRQMRAAVEQHADEFVEKFYAHLKAFEGTQKFLKDDQVIHRLLKAQRDYLLSLFDAKFDEAYYQHRRLIGQTHFRIGLDFQWYIGAYALYLEFATPIVLKLYRDDELKFLATTSAIRKAVLLDMTIVLESYHENDKAALEKSQMQVLHQEKLAAVGLLSSGLAHEIGNPLASILAVCDNQLRKTKDPQVADKFSRIREQVLRITKIVRQLVSFARPAPPEWRAVNVSEIIESAVTIAKLSRDVKFVDVKIDIPSDLPAPHGIADQLSQVFLNLLLNAFDAMKEKGGQVSIRAYPQESLLHVEIQDTGTGIHPEQLQRLFTPFFTTKEHGKGTGLGLHVSLDIVKRHKGDISVTSEPGIGTTFTVKLPVHRAAEQGNA